MDTVYITSYVGRPSNADKVIAPAPPANGANGSHTKVEAEAASQIKNRRWKLTVRLDGQLHQTTAEVTLVDPFIEADYKTVFEKYLRNTDQPPWSRPSLDTGNGAAPDSLDDEEVARKEHQIEAYAHTLLSQLGLPVLQLQPNATELPIYIVERHETDHAGGAMDGIHCLAWELLESIRLPWLPKTRLCVSRVVSFPSRRLTLPRGPLSTAGESPKPFQTLAMVQADPGATYRVLLVVARDFSRTGAERDVEPDLAQYPLMNVKKKLRSRLQLEVARPGSLEELRSHLEKRTSEGVRFNLVHFDLHGQIQNDEYGIPTPWLLFAKRTYATQSNGYHLPQTKLAKAIHVADLLAKHEVENVVLNACLSAYNHSTSLTNLSHIFLRRGIQNISAMWFYVHWQTVAKYLETFYNQLLLKGVDFHVAAQEGREAVRKSPTMHSGRLCKDDFLCVNYARQEHGSDSMTAREPSPAPSNKSQSSSTSNTSSRSFMSGGWRPATPLLADALLLSGDEPVIRMTLHLLELEYKLMTFRIVYASDMHRDKAGLSETMEHMVAMWMSTNMIDEVYYYNAKDFANPKILKGLAVPHSNRRSRVPPTASYLPRRLLLRPVSALRQRLHVIRDVDAVVDPGWQYDDATNSRNEARRVQAQEGLQRFARRLHTEADSYCLFLGSKDAQWFRRFLQHLHGAWWVHMPWAVDVPSRSPIQRGSRAAGRNDGMDAMLNLDGQLGTAAG